MNYKKTFGIGILIYAVAFLVMSGFVAYRMNNTVVAQISTMVAVVGAAFWGGRNLNTPSRKEILKYSILWFIIVIVLDMLFTTPFTGWDIFSQWNFLLGYVLILTVPMLGARR